MTAHLLNRTSHLMTWLRPVTTLAGIAIVLLAVATYLWHLDLGQLMDWLGTVFGPLFLTVYGILVMLAAVAFWQLSRSYQPLVWFELGSQAAGGIATLALTFTLLGISLGIESLSAQPLTPESVGAVVQSLTQHFSTAFLTTILGLPTANALRAALAVRWRMLNPAVYPDTNPNPL